MAALRHQLEQREAERQAAGSAWEESVLVFTTTAGRPLNHSVVTHQFQRPLKRVGLPRQRFYDLRHTCSSLLLEAGASLYDVKNAMRHSQIGITADLYGHPYDEAKRATARRMDEILGKAVERIYPEAASAEPLS